MVFSLVLFPDLSFCSQAQAMPHKQLSKKPREDVELTDVDTDSDMDLQPVRLPHGLPLDEPPPCLPLSNLTEVEQVCQQHLSNGYIPMSVFLWLVQKLPSELLRASALTRRGTPPMVSPQEPTTTLDLLVFEPIPGSTRGLRLFLLTWCERARTQTSPQCRCCTTLT